MLCGVDAELRDFLCVGGDGDEVLGDGGFVVAEIFESPVARGVRVGHGLERGEGLGGDEEERLVGAEVARGFGEVGAVDVGDEAEGEVALRVVLQRFVGHDRAEVGAADADVDDVADALAGVALPLAAADAVGEGGHLVETAWTSGTTSSPSTMIDSAFGARRATCRTARFSVMLIFSPREHGVDALLADRARSASCTSSLRVSSVMRFLE